MFRIVLVWLALGLVVFGEGRFEFTKTPGRLPKQVRPQLYQVRVEPRLEEATLTGRARVSLEVLEATKQLVLNSAGLTVGAKVRDAAGEEVAATARVDEAAQLLTIELAEELKPGAAELELEWYGTLNERPQGLFITRYQTAHGEKKALASQMQVADARRLLPCWDEPVFRAEFELTVLAPAGKMVISNMPIEQRTASGAAGWEEVKFAKTPAMSTYLLALAVGDFEALEEEADGVKLRVITTEGKREQGRYALKATKEILAYYREYFGTAYPLPKLDQFSFPGFPAGGMENWGAIFYHDTAMLVDEATASQANRQRVYEVVAHELAHQWFGNLVTNAWWDNLWLNEGFASWMGTKATERFNPDWNIGLRSIGARESAMYRDARATTHPIQQEVKTEDQANDAFDEITYAKGMSFLRMLEQYLGEEPFRRGLHRYFQRHAMSNATTADLWAALEEASGQPVGAMAAQWTEQPGFPLVRVTQKAETLTLTLTQERFAINQRQPKPLLWQTPISLAPWGQPTKETVVLHEQPKVLETKEWARPVRANVGGLGYFRVAYDPETFAAFLRDLPGLPEADRMSLLADTWALFQGAYVPAATFLNLMDRLGATEESPAVWSEMVERLRMMDELHRGEPIRENYRQLWARPLVARQFARVGWEPRADEPVLVKRLRGELIETLGGWGNAEVVAEARRRLAEYERAPETLPGDLRRAVCYVVGRHATAAEYDRLLRLARRAVSTQEKYELYRALAASPEPTAAEKTLALSLTDERPPTEAARLVRLVATEGEHPEAAWAFAQQHAEALHAKLAFHQRNEFIPGLASTFANATRADELEAFARRSLRPEARPSVAKAVDDIRFQAEFRGRLLPQFAAWRRQREEAAGH